MYAATVSGTRWRMLRPSSTSWRISRDAMSRDTTSTRSTCRGTSFAPPVRVDLAHLEIAEGGMPQEPPLIGREQSLHLVQAPAGSRRHDHPRQREQLLGLPPTGHLQERVHPHHKVQAVSGPDIFWNSRTVSTE